MADARNEETAKPQIADGVGLGIDIVDIARMERILERTPRFKVRVFTEGERAYCERTSHPATHYATRFAAKEAVLKALGTGFSNGIGPQDVEVVRTSKGRPVAKLHRRAAQEAKAQGVVDLPISLSFTHADAVACAMAITVDSLNAAAKRKDPMEELSRQFKEARLLLDDLPAAGVGKADPDAVSAQAEGTSDVPTAADALNVENASNTLDAQAASYASSAVATSDATAVSAAANTPDMADALHGSNAAATPNAQNGPTEPDTLDLELDE